jgi:16S rRNA (cytosine1407-C5)-methyltransferase
MLIPEAFYSMVRDLPGFEDWDGFVESLEHTSSLSIRHHPLRSKYESLQEIPWEPLGEYLEQRPLFARDPGWHAGAYYVQDSSSMLTGQIAFQALLSLDLPASQSPIVLDACAAPGGKTTHILDLWNSYSKDPLLMVANEVVPERAQTLKENLLRWGYPEAFVTKHSMEEIGNAGPFFDMMLVDAPCSGEGMWRKEPVAVSQWSEKLVQECGIRQKDILNHLSYALNPGGILVYSTCTYNPIENEEIILQALEFGFEPVDIRIPTYQGVISYSFQGVNCFRCLPHLVRGEGQFIAVLRKMKGSAREENLPSIKPITRWKILDSKSNLMGKVAPVTDRITPIIDQRSQEYYFILSGVQSLLERAWSLGLKLEPIFPYGEIKGKDFIPGHGWAMWNQRPPDLFLERDLSYEEAIIYLKKESLPSGDGPPGIRLVKYKDFPLGFIKEIAGRTNNLFPMGWRLRN